MKTKLLLMLVVVGLAAGVAGANMLVNPSFEDGAFGANVSPDYWEHYYTDYIPVHTWVNSTAGAHSGSKYMRMFNWTAGAYEAYLGQTVPGVKEGKDYSFSVWAKNGGEDQTNLAAIWCDWLNSFDGLIGSDVVYIPITEPNWIEIDFGAFTAPEEAVTAEFWLIAARGNGINAICYDDVSMLGPDPNISAGPDMISWDGETVSLTGSTSLTGYSTISWSAEPAAGAVITGGDTLTPTVQVNPIIESGPATIANHSFENGLDNWVIISGNGHGTWNGYAGAIIYMTPTDGRMCAYVDGVTDEEAGVLSQVLTNNLLAANTTYTLTVDVVNDGYYEEDVEYRVQLLAGGSVLAEDNDGHVLEDYGEWETSTVNYSTGSTHTYLGEPLEIRLIAKDGTNEMTFDNVHLTADPAFGAYVPDDVLTYKLTLDIDGKYDTMKIDAYPDACAAWLGAGLREATDLVGDDCITSLADLTELAQTWIDDNALTEPAAKERDPGPEPGTGEIAIGNAGFEFPEMVDGDYTVGTVDVWGYIGDDDSFGVWDPDATDEIWYGYGGTAPEGENVGYVQVGTEPEYPGGLAQVLAETFTANTNYTLTVQVGNTEYYTASGDYVIELLAGGSLTDNGGQITAGTVLASFTENAQDNIEPDTFELRTVVYTFDSAHLDLVGQNLQIRLYLTNDEEVDFDDVRLYFKSGMIPSPANGAYIPPASELELSWTNMDPNKPGDPVYVDVWFGTEPNELNPAYDFNKIVDAVEDANSVTVDANDLGTYYWRVDSYIYGSATGDPIEGTMLSFHAVNDVPVSVDSGDDMITWSGQAVQLEPSIDDDGASALTIAWSAEPERVFFNPNDGGDGTTSSAENPTATITQWTYSAANIVNAGFEVPVLADGARAAPSGWSLAGGEIWAVNPGPPSSEYPAYGGTAPEGENIGIAGTDGSEGGLRQVLLETLAADTTYELIVEVGRNKIYDWVGYKVQLLAGGTVLAEDDNSLTIAKDTFETSTITYNSGATPAQLGEPLEIRLLSVSNGLTAVEVNFDDVRLTADPPFSPPGAQTVTLTVSVHDDVGSDEDTMTIDIYDNPCLAAKGAGEEIDPADFDADCDTDLEDYAAMAEEWLVYNELTVSIVKP